MRDSGANMIKAVKDNGFLGICFFTHILLLVNKDTLGMVDKPASHNAIHLLMELGRWITGHFNKKHKRKQTAEGEAGKTH